MVADKGSGPEAKVALPVPDEIEVSVVTSFPVVVEPSRATPVSVSVVVELSVVTSFPVKVELSVVVSFPDTVKLLGATLIAEAAPMLFTVIVTVIVSPFPVLGDSESVPLETEAVGIALRIIIETKIVPIKAVCFFIVYVSFIFCRIMRFGICYRTFPWH